MTKKSDITRKMVNDKNMKIVIIRLDYAGVIDLNKLTIITDEICSTVFSGKIEMHNNQINVNMEDFKSISKSLSIPISAIIKEKFCRYLNFKSVACTAHLDISQYYMGLTITCENNYDGLDKYVSMFVEIATAFKEKISFFAPRRLGLRKKRVQDFDKFSDIEDVFEKAIFCRNTFIQSDGNEQVRGTYIDVLKNNSKHNIQVNIIRDVELVLKDDHNVYRAALDIDAYYTDGKVLNDKQIRNLLEESNEYEFEIYKNCMTEKYLNTIK